VEQAGQGERHRPALLPRVGAVSQVFTVTCGFGRRHAVREALEEVGLTPLTQREGLACVRIEARLREGEAEPEHVEGWLRDYLGEGFLRVEPIDVSTLAVLAGQGLI
jgi:hypothetical protein